MYDQVKADVLRELDGVTEALQQFMYDVERDRREPDKIMCHLASARRRLFDAQNGGSE